MEKEWQPVSSREEAIEIIKEHPITKEMTYAERLAEIKSRFGL